MNSNSVKATNFEENFNLYFCCAHIGWIISKYKFQHFCKTIFNDFKSKSNIFVLFLLNFVDYWIQSKSLKTRFTNFFFLDKDSENNEVTYTQKINQKCNGEEVFFFS
jgi:hypothetical protein